MANRRMFSLLIIDTDIFLDMPLSTQALYFHLSMRADDDGFIGNAKKIQRMIGSSDDDFKLLLAKGFIFKFDTGVCVIKHWRIHNYIQKDRYTNTIYQDEKKQISKDKSNVYQINNSNLDKELLSMDTDCIHDVDSSDTQVRLGKDRLDKVSKGNKRIETEIKELNFSDDLTKTLIDFSEMRKTIKKPLTKKALNLLIAKLDKIANNEQERIEILNNSIMNCWQGVFELKNQPKKVSREGYGLDMSQYDRIRG